MMDSRTESAHRPTQRRGLYLGPIVLSILTSAVGLPAATDSQYEVPSSALLDIVDAERTPFVRLSPDRGSLLLLDPETLPPLSLLREPELRLAGMRLNPRNDGPSRSRAFTAARLLDVSGGEEREIRGLPTGARLQDLEFSPDSKHVAVVVGTPESIELWHVATSDLAATRLVQRPLHLVAQIDPTWLPDSSGLVVTLVPAGRGSAPEPEATAVRPVIQESLGRSAPARTYQDLLSSPADEELFRHHFRSQLALVTLDGTLRELGGPDLLWDVSVSPNGRRLLVETVHEPFSYQVPISRFPRRIEVWDLAGNVKFELADLPLATEVPMSFDSVPQGPRSVSWRPDRPATLQWAEALDGGDAGAEAEQRDRVYALADPYDGPKEEIATLGLRYAGTYWSAEGQALVQERWWSTRQVRLHSIDDTGAAPRALFDYSFEDRYANPGSPSTRAVSGHRLLETSKDGKAIYLIGSGASPQGDRPFLDRYDLETGKTERLFHCAEDVYEQPLAWLDDSETQLLTRRERPQEVPNYWVRDLATGKSRQLTDIPHPTPQLKGVHKELLHYTREDGLELTGTLYLPPGKTAADGPFPTLLWAYPREFKSAAAASQVRGSKQRFVRVTDRSATLWLALGYAVLDDPAMPIVGEDDKEPNDTYVEQLVASARAATEKLVEMGVSRPGGFAIAGHSYGAFMTANLLAHSDLFATGIARSGAYNRTLTPFGFQAEERSFWEAPEVYFAMSPFMHAHKVNEPVLLIHGEVDNNSGTFPMQSERYYAALKGNGATVRLVMLPYESHGYRARESVLHVLWETEQWLDTYLKGAFSGGSPSGAP